MENIITEEKRVRKSTSPLVNLKIDDYTLENIKDYSNQSEHEISMRIRELDKEWDIERVLGTNMSAIALTGIGLSILVNRKWLALPAVVLGFFAQHALQGWCPPVPFFRSLKVRTRDEINQEKHALKAIRGDYKGIRSALDAFIAAKKD
jgi:hypothetical protein